jgi:hypothetical protein
LWVFDNYRFERGLLLIRPSMGTLPTL